MSVATRQPLRTAGGNLFSGGVNTPELNYTTGGVVAGSVYSGFNSGLSLVAAGQYAIAGTPAGSPSFMLFSGAGRINNIIAFNPSTSGTQVLFYDAALATSGGPMTASGHKVLAVIPAFPPANTLSGASAVSTPILGNMPFQSGLCVSALSGCPGFSISWTPEVNPALG